MENFKPLFKEKADPNYNCQYFPGHKGYYPPKNEQYYYNNGAWVSCDEDTIAGLWESWITSKNAKKHVDDEGFTVFGNTHTQYGGQEG